MHTTFEEINMTAPTVLDDPTGRYEPYDFSRPAQLGRDHSRRLEAAFESFARLWSSQLTAKVRVRAHLTLEAVELISYEEYADSLPGTTAMVAASFVDRDEPCLVQFDLEAALMWVMQMMGGKSTKLPTARTFTHIELALVRHLMDDTLEHLSACLGAVLPGEPQFSAVHYNPQFLQVVPNNAAVIVARYTMRLGDTETTATVMLPASAVIDRLAETGGEAPADDTAGLALTQVNATPMEIALRLKPITVGAGEVLDLAPGDLLRFAHPETKPFEVMAGQTPIAHATLGSQGSRLACTITTIHEEKN